MGKKRPEQELSVDTDVDRFPSVRKALHVIANEVDRDGGQPEHLEIHFMQSGEATWRMWIKGEEETRGSVISDLE